MKTKRKKKIKINGDFDGDKTDYDIQNIKKNSIIYNSNTFNATANPGIISSKINTTEFPNFGYSYYPRKSTISDKLCDSKSINKIKKAYFLNQHNSRNYRNQHDEKREFSPFDFRTYNKITERSLEDKKGKKDKKRLCRNKNNKININIDNLNTLIEKFEKEIGELDEEIDGLMCERATYNDELKNYMQELNNDVGKIIQLISNIKQNTDTNETTVKLICNDIKNLDSARNNITVTISSLTKLIM